MNLKMFMNFEKVHQLKKFMNLKKRSILKKHQIEEESSQI